LSLPTNLPSDPSYYITYHVPGYGYKFELWLGFGASGEYLWNKTSGPPGPDYVEWQKLSTSWAGLPTDSRFNFLSNYDSGINETNGNNDTQGATASELLTILQVIADAAGLASPEIGLIDVGWEALKGYAGTAGEYQDSAHLDTLSPAASASRQAVQWFEAKNGSFLDAPYDLYFQNRIAAADYVELTFNASADASHISQSSISISGANQVADEDFDPIGIGANESYSYLVEPAVSIGGYVYQSGTTPPATSIDGVSNPVTVSLTQTCTTTGGSVVETDFTNIPIAANGSWQFFAEPGCTYTSQAVFSESPIGTYTSSAVAIPRADTDPTTGTTEGKAFDNAVDMSIVLGQVSGVVTNSCTNVPVYPAEVGMWQDGYTGYVQLEDESNGDYTLYFPQTASYEMVSGYETYYDEDEINPSFTDGDSYVEDFALTPTGGCGGGRGRGRRLRSLWNAYPRPKGLRPDPEPRPRFESRGIQHFKREVDHGLVDVCKCNHSGRIPGHQRWSPQRDFNRPAYLHP
jgi:hypothetical protein